MRRECNIETNSIIWGVGMRSKWKKEKPIPYEAIEEPMVQTNPVVSLRDFTQMDEFMWWRHNEKKE